MFYAPKINIKLIILQGLFSEFYGRQNIATHYIWYMVISFHGQIVPRKIIPNNNQIVP